MEKGLLITADHDSSEGIIDLISDVIDASAVMDKNTLAITMKFDKAVVGDHDVTKKDKNLIFIKSANGKNIDVLIANRQVSFQRLNPQTNALDNTIITFSIMTKEIRIDDSSIINL
jgi:hypothetical protein